MGVKFTINHVRIDLTWNKLDKIVYYMAIWQKVMKKKPEWVFVLQVQCRELDNFKIEIFEKLFRNSLDFFGIFWGDFLWDFFGIFFWRNFLDKSILEDCLGRIFLEGFFGGGFFWEEFFVYIVKVS